MYGAAVTITGRNAKNLAKVAADIEKVSTSGKAPLQVVGDLLDDDTPRRLVEQTIAKFGRLDFLVNNAGGSTPRGDYGSPNLMQEFDTVFKLNVRSVVALIQLAVPVFFLFTIDSDLKPILMSPYSLCSIWRKVKATSSTSLRLVELCP